MAAIHQILPTYIYLLMEAMYQDKLFKLESLMIGRKKCICVCVLIVLGMMECGIV